jgi:hypothetical protein
MTRTAGWRELNQMQINWSSLNTNDNPTMAGKVSKIIMKGSTDIFFFLHPKPYKTEKPL